MKKLNEKEEKIIKSTRVDLIPNEAINKLTKEDVEILKREVGLS